MRISDPIKAYTSQSNSNSSYRVSPDESRVSRNTGNAAAKTTQISDKGYEKANNQLKEPNKLITRQERDYFIKMFPENSEKIEKHVLFNRSGRLQTHNVSKGQLVDQKA